MPGEFSVPYYEQKPEVHVERKNEREPKLRDLKEQLSQSSVSALFVYPIKSCAGSSLQTAEIVPTGIKHDREMMLVFPNGRFVSQRDRGCERLGLVKPEFLNDSLVKVTTPNMPDLYVPVAKDSENGGVIEASVHKTTDIKTIDQGEDAGKWFSEYLGSEVRLVAMAKDYTRQVSQRWAPRKSDQVGFADGYNFLLISRESLDDLNQRLPDQLPVSRFRPNIVLSGSNIPYGEDQMKTIKIGDVTFDIVKPCIRCVITTIDQEKGIRGQKEPLATLAKYRMTKLKTGDKGGILGQNLIHQNTGTINVGDNVRVLQTQPPPVFLEVS
jgi:uncharacterized protein YcbX